MEAKFHTSIRLAQDVRARLLDSAHANNRTLSGEINHRLKLAMSSACTDTQRHQSAPLPDT